MSEQIPAPRSQLRRGTRFAALGLAFGFLGLAAAAYRVHLASEQPPPPPQEPGLSIAIGKSFRVTLGKARKEPAPIPPSPTSAAAAWPVGQKLSLAATVLGFIGAAFDCASWLAGEHRRWTWASLCVGVLAMAWTQVVVAVAFAVGLVVLLLILSNL